MQRQFKKTTFATLLALAVAAPLAAHAADDKAMTSSKDHENTTFSDKMHMHGLQTETDALKAALKVGVKADTYRQVLSSMGYQITAVNDAEPDYLEYEVVKGKNSHELQIDRDTKSGLVTKVDVAPNLWRADSTKAALKGESFKPMSTAEFSDRKYFEPWSKEKDMLVSALPAGQDKPYYTAKLKEMGYQITSTNEAEKDHVEMEVVKGPYSYEIQLETKDGAQKVNEVDVTSNLWQAEGTEKALAAQGR